MNWQSAVWQAQANSSNHRRRVDVSNDEVPGRLVLSAAPISNPITAPTPPLPDIKILSHLKCAQFICRCESAGAIKLAAGAPRLSLSAVWHWLRCGPLTLRTKHSHVITLGQYAIVFMQIQPISPTFNQKRKPNYGVIIWAQRWKLCIFDCVTKL